jgi:hypothetical protein
MPESPTLTASWLGTRWAVDPVAVDVRRRGGELFAVRDPASAEWRYPVWQFDEEGNVKPEVARVLAAARQAGIGSERLGAILNKRAGLSGGRTLLDSLLEGDDRAVLAELRA